MDIIIFNKTTGKIRQLMQIHEDAIPDQYDSATEDYIEGTAYILSQYVEPISKIVTDFQSMNTTLTGQTITNIPNPTHATVNGGGVYDEFDITDGELILNPDAPGEYRVILRAFPYLEMEYIINAT